MPLQAHLPARRSTRTGDVRYEHALEKVREAQRSQALDRVSLETAIQALGALAKARDALLSNVLTTKALNEARRSGTLLRFLAEGVIALDVDGRVTFANPAAHELLRLEPGALLGRDFHDAVHHRRMGHGRVEREECALLRALRSGAADRSSASDHDVFERSDGSTFLVGFTSAVVTHAGQTTGLAVAFRDITGEKEHETSLLLFRAALDAIAEPVFWVDRSARFLYANRAGAEHMGCAPEDLLRRSVFDFDVGLAPEAWDPLWERVRREGLVRIETRHRTADGSVVPVVVKITHVEHGDRQFHVAVVRRQGAPR